MRRSRVGVLAMIAVVSSMAVAPAAFAGGSFGRGGMGGRIGGAPHRIGSPNRPFPTRPFVDRPFPNRPFPNRPFGHRSFHHHFNNRFSSVGLPLVVYATPPLYYADPGYIDPPSYYSPPPVYSTPAYYSPPPIAAPAVNTIAIAPVPPPPSAPPAPTVVEFATGRYELRGDGMATPYAWVWIPNPPSSPPPSRSANAGRDDASGYRSRLYRWIDEQGTLHLTDSLDEVPPQYRTPTKQAPTS
jgi:hypothetical protein